MNEPLVIILLGTGLMMGAARLRKWRLVSAQGICETARESETLAAAGRNSSDIWKNTVETGADLV